MLRSPSPAASSLHVLHFSLLADVTHGISSRHGGVSPEPYASLNMGVSTGDSKENVIVNRGIFAESLGISLAQVAIGRLSHGNGVAVARAGDPLDGVIRRPQWSADRVAMGDEAEKVFASDAVVSDAPGLYFMLTFADCVPLLFFDRERRVVGAAHAGWRGTALGIGPAVVRAMQVEFGSRPEDIAIGIGPAIGPCCYAVGPDVLDAFRRLGFDPVIERDGQTRLDLAATNQRQLAAAGIPAQAIETRAICTSCHVDDFYSHRAEGGHTGRFAALIGLE